MTTLAGWVDGPIARDGVGRVRRACGEVVRVEIGSQGETDE